MIANFIIYVQGDRPSRMVPRVHILNKQSSWKVKEKGGENVCLSTIKLKLKHELPTLILVKNKIPQLQNDSIFGWVEFWGLILQFRFFGFSPKI